MKKIPRVGMRDKNVQFQPIEAKTQTCPVCEHTMGEHGLTGIDISEEGKSHPKRKTIGVGDVTICFCCGEILEVSEDLSLEVADEACYDKLIEEERNLLLNLQLMIRNASRKV